LPVTAAWTWAKKVGSEAIVSMGWKPLLDGPL
jgi:hypothetical protein